MTGESNIHGGSIRSVVEQILEAKSGRVLIANPPPDVFNAVLSVLMDGEVDCRLLLDESTQREVFDDFISGSRAAELTESSLELRIGGGGGVPVVITDEQVVVPVGVPGAAAGLTDDDADFVDAVSDFHESAWENASPHTFDIQGYSAISDLLEQHTNTEMRESFDQAIEGADSLGKRGDSLDVVTLALLLGARHEAQLYHLSEWGEETGISSKATFSRTKTQLEENGLIKTESIPIDVGRPRLKLLLADEELSAVDTSEFVDLARSKLS